MAIPDFLSRMNEVEWDAFLMVVADLQDGTAPDRLQALGRFVHTLRREIDEVNARRDALGQRVANIDAAAPVLDRHLAAAPDDLESRLLRDVLAGWRLSLKAEIEELRPDGKMGKKDDAARKLDLLTRLSDTVRALNRAVLAARPGDRARPADAPPPRPHEPAPARARAQ